ncbi:MAG TPA: helix-turn-helix domain-containing protein [Streptosporangiaceae bacterium]|nr:helix-turn-helix domain-containing protein [Streptosporangiaceae bacterium]
MAAQAGPASAGRPRCFEPAGELRLPLDAMLRVMERHSYADAPVADILAEAGLSTRSFYRHFLSKDQLMCEQAVVSVRSFCWRALGVIPRV